jgi:AhpD family alkylhydroperoxidase
LAREPRHSPGSVNLRQEKDVFMSEEATKFFQEWPVRMSQAKAEAPEIAKAFGPFSQALMKEGALTVREKELIALAIGLALRCDRCINTHAEKALKAGATKEQILEAAGVAVMMQGGPAYTYLPNVVEAIRAVQQR